MIVGVYELISKATKFALALLLGSLTPHQRGQIFLGKTAG